MLGALANAGSGLMQGYLRAVTASLQDQRRRQMADEDRRADTEEWERRQRMAQDFQSQREERQAALEAQDPMNQIRLKIAQGQLDRMNRPAMTFGQAAPQAVRPEFHGLPFDPNENIPSQYLVPQPSQTEIVAGQRFEAGQVQRQREGTVAQLRTKMLNAVRNSDMPMAQRVAEQFNRIAGTHGTGDGLSEYRQAKETVDRERVGRAGRILGHEGVKARTARALRPPAGRAKKPGGDLDPFFK